MSKYPIDKSQRNMVIVLLLIAIILFIVYASISKTSYNVILLSLLHAIAVSLVIGVLFDYASRGSTFRQYLTAALKNLVLDKNYLIDCTPVERRDILLKILNPQQENADRHQDINDYVRNYLEASMNLFDNDYRGTVSLDLTFSENVAQERVLCTYDFTYEIFRVGDKFQPLRFSNTEEQGGKLVSLTLTDNEGRIKNIDVDSMDEMIKESATGVTWMTRQLEVPEEMSRSKCIKVHRVDEEIGADHWGVAGYTCTQPVHGIDVKILIPNGYSIKNKDIYLRERPVVIHNSGNGAWALHFSCNQWLDAGLGFSILVAKDAL